MGKIDSENNLEGKIDPELKKALKNVLERMIKHSDNPNEKKFEEYSLNELYKGVINETDLGIRFAEICKAYQEKKLDAICNLLDTVKDFDTYEQ